MQFNPKYLSELLPLWFIHIIVLYLKLPVFYILFFVFFWLFHWLPPRRSAELIWSHWGSWLSDVTSPSFLTSELFIIVNYIKQNVFFFKNCCSCIFEWSIEHYIKSPVLKSIFVWVWGPLKIPLCVICDLSLNSIDFWIALLFHVTLDFTVSTGVVTAARWQGVWKINSHDCFQSKL